MLFFSTLRFGITVDNWTIQSQNFSCKQCLDGSIWWSWYSIKPDMGCLLLEIVFNHSLIYLASSTSLYFKGFWICGTLHFMFDTG